MIILNLSLTADDRERRGRTRIMEEAINVLRSICNSTVDQHPEQTITIQVFSEEPKGPYG